MYADDLARVSLEASCLLGTASLFPDVEQYCSAVLGLTESTINVVLSVGPRSGGHAAAESAEDCLGRIAAMAAEPAAKVVRAIVADAKTDLRWSIGRILLDQRIRPARDPAPRRSGPGARRTTEPVPSGSLDRRRQAQDRRGLRVQDWTV